MYTYTSRKSKYTNRVKYFKSFRSQSWYFKIFLSLLCEHNHYDKDGFIHSWGKKWGDTLYQLGPTLPN